MSTSERPKFNENNVYRVRRDTKLNQGLFLVKLILKKHGTAQIEGMGETISLVAKFSQILQKNGLVVVNSIRSQNVQREQAKQINPKLVVVVSKSAEFDKLTADLVLRN